MGKKKTLINKLIKIQEKEGKELKKQVELFYEDGERVDIISSSEKDPFLSIFSTFEKKDINHSFTEEQMLQKCMQIRENVKHGKQKNIEIDFRKMVEQFDGFSHELQTTLVRVLAMDASKPIYVQITKGDLLDSLIFIGTDEEVAFLLTKDVTGKDTVIRLSEINVLSFKAKPALEDCCFVTIYSWMRAVLFAGIFMDSDKVVKQLLSSEKTKKLYLEPPKIDKIKKGNKKIPNQIE